MESTRGGGENLHPTEKKTHSNNSDNLQANLNLKLFEWDYISWESSAEMSNEQMIVRFFSIFFVSLSFQIADQNYLIGFRYFFSVLDCHAFVCRLCKM